jgi:Flp pilus assembly protein TadD
MTLPSQGIASNFRIGVVLLMTIVILGGVWVVAKKWFEGKGIPETDDPRLTSKTIYRNVRPEVHYVGDEACIRCHREMAEAYHRHPMARSLAPVAQADPVEQFGASAQNPFDAGGFRYDVERSKNGMIHAEQRLDTQGRIIAQIKAEVTYALGSGARGRSFLVERDGFLFQSPISWYTGSKTWDLAPSYRSRNEHFTRPVPDECIYCHANRAEPIDGSLNHFRTPVFQGYAIGCERCHGPGELHVQRRENHETVNGVDDTIVNPVRLDPLARESVCQQCHLQAVVRTFKRNRKREDFRPGLPLDEFVSFFVLPSSRVDTKRAVGHVEQMHASRCFQESGSPGEKLGCLTCHDPHHYPGPEEKLEFYRTRCLSCHNEKSCALDAAERRRRSAKDNCIECHMPNMASSNIAHTAITDHRIVRLPSVARSPAPQKNGGMEKYPIVPFADSSDDAGPEKQRDLGVALIEFASKQPSAKWGQLALPLLETSLSRWPDDIPALEAKGYALMLQGRDQDSLDTFESALSRAPGREKSLFGAALIAARMGRNERAIQFWVKAIALNPWNWEYHDELAKLYAAKEEWKMASEQCEKALRLNIASWDTRKLFIQSLLRGGEKDRARKEFEILLGFEPPDPESLRRWFEEESRATKASNR